MLKCCSNLDALTFKVNALKVDAFGEIQPSWISKPFYENFASAIPSGVARVLFKEGSSKGPGQGWWAQSLHPLCQPPLCCVGTREGGDL